MVENQRNVAYHLFLNYLSKSSSSRCSCLLHLHGHNWIPAPCLSSKPKSLNRASRYRHSQSHHNMTMASHRRKTAKPTSSKDGLQERIEHINKDIITLKAAHQRLKEGEEISAVSKEVITEWSKNYKAPEDDKIFTGKSPSAKSNPLLKVGAKKSYPVGHQTEDLLKNFEVSLKSSQKKDNKHHKNDENGEFYQRKYKRLSKYVKKVEAENEDLKLKLKRNRESRWKDPKEEDSVIKSFNKETAGVRSKSTEQPKTSIHFRSYEDVEEAWKMRLSEMKAIYEDAIGGYKEQLTIHQDKYEALVQQREQENLHLSLKEKKLVADYEKNVALLHGRLSAEKCSNCVDGVPELQELLEQQNNEIKLLKSTVKLFSGDTGDNQYTTESIAQLESTLMRNIGTVLSRSEGKIDSDNAQLVLKMIQKLLKESLKDWKEFQFKEDNDVQSAKDNGEDSLFLRKKVSDLERLNEDLVKQNEKDQHTIERLLKEPKNKHTMIAKVPNEPKGHLEDFEEYQKLYAVSQRKLLEIQAANSELTLELKIVTDRLKTTFSEEGENKELLKTLEGQVSTLKIERHELILKAETQREKLNLFQRQLDAKDELLNRVSGQLEERIRESANLSSQIERLKEEHQRELKATTLSNGSLQGKIHELQQQNEQLLTKLASFREGKETLERTLKNHARTLEEQVTQLTLKNTTYQKQLEIISVSYKTIFSGRENLLPNSYPFPPLRPPVDLNVPKTSS